ncbi:LPS-assembly protein LptD [Persephonella atlantica]|uniref:LPS-assembly protein LptD n=1 Tax=Persephonella atlantica TaxID=2699429 RepID=A0ABS1GJW5_9AQUI|nr:LPS-assembly protein LptD [Persephonella atlantica]MBK3333027.1 LPS-assembly protein LptD [Persephonella atlantica]
MKKIIIPVFCILILIGFSYSKAPVSIEAESIKKVSETTVVAEGSVIVKYKGEVLKADKIIYDKKNKKIFMEGNIKIKTERYNLTADKGWIDEKGANGEFYRVTGVIEKYYYIKAEKIKKFGNRYYFYNGEISTCSFDQYDWYIKTKKGVLIKDDSIKLYNVSLKFCGVPVFFTPFFSYPATNRKTGFLFPEIGTDSYNDFKYTQPFFLVLTRHSDMTLTFDYRNQQGKGIDVEYRNRLSTDSYYTGSFTVFTENSGGKWWQNRIYPPLKNRWRIYGKSDVHREDFDLSFIYDIPSDPYFFEDIYNATQLRYQSYTKTQLIGLLDKKYFTFELNFDFLYDLTKDNNEQTLQRLPELRFYLKKSKIFKNFPLYIDFLSVNTNFYREKGTSGFRSDNTVNIELYSYLKGISNLIRFSPRGTWYYITSGFKKDRSPTRNIFSIEDRLRYTFIRNYSSFLHSVIPEVRFTRITKVNQENLPSFDKEDRIKDAKDIDFSLFNILNFSNNNFLSWEISTGYTLNNYYYLGNNRLDGHKKPVKNRFYFQINGFYGENTLYYDFYFNQIVRSITTFTIPVTSWFTYSISHSFDKGLFEGSTTINQINQTARLYYRNISFSFSVLSNIKQGYIQRKSARFTLNRKCWNLRVTYSEDFNIITGKTFRSIYVYINILKTDIKLPFVSRTL